MSTKTPRAPTFTLDGKLLDLTVMRRIKKFGAQGFGMLSPYDGPNCMMVTAQDIADAAKQIPPRKK